MLWLLLLLLVVVVSHVYLLWEWVRGKEWVWMGETDRRSREEGAGVVGRDDGHTCKKAMHEQVRCPHFLGFNHTAKAYRACTWQVSSVWTLAWSCYVQYVHGFVLLTFCGFVSEEVRKQGSAATHYTHGTPL